MEIVLYITPSAKKHWYARRESSIKKKNPS